MQNIISCYYMQEENMKINNLPKLEKINELLEYDTNTGNLIWKKDLRGGVKKGQIAGYLKKMRNTTDENG